MRSWSQTHLTEWNISQGYFTAQRDLLYPPPPLKESNDNSPTPCPITESFFLGLRVLIFAAFSVKYEISFHSNVFLNIKNNPVNQQELEPVKF